MNPAAPFPEPAPAAVSSPSITGFFDPATATISYLVADPVTGKAAVIDSVLDFDPKAGRVSTKSADALADAAKGYAIEWILETHAHADHLSAAPYLKARLGGRIGIGAEICGVQKTWSDIFNLGPAFPADGSQFDRLFKDGDRFTIGTLGVTVWHVPGHTAADIAYLVEGRSGLKHVFVGDTLFMPDYGTARTDFPGGDARTLYRSIRRILSLPPETRLYMCHDYQPGGRDPKWETTVAEQRVENVHVKDGVDEDAFVAFREGRDKTLAAPTLILPSVQVNIRGGELPPSESNGTVYLKIPVNRI